MVTKILKEEIKVLNGWSLMWMSDNLITVY